MLIGFSLAAYALLKHGAIEQVDQAVRQQLRTVVFAAESKTASSGNVAATSAELAQELRSRGFSVATSTDQALIITSTRKAEQVEMIADSTDGESSSPAARAVPPALINAIDQHAAPTKESTRAAVFAVPATDGGSLVAIRTIDVNGRSVRLAATEPLDEVQELLDQAKLTILIAIPLLVAMALAVGYAQARKALAPVAAMTAQARQIGSKNLHERLPVANANDELGELAITFNAVLDRVDRAMEQQRQFTADASHELRTPVAIIRSEADVTLDTSGATPEEYREALRVIRGGSEQLSRIVNDMFLLARADAGQASLSKRPMYLNDLVNDTVRSLRALAARQNLRVESLAAEELPFTGDEELLRRALVNLLDNAIKHAPSGSTIVVAAVASAGGTQLSVTDSGPGIPPESRDLVFNRFYRTSSARSTDISAHGSGAGLGLAIAREIVELHGGTLTLQHESYDTASTTFTMHLPRP